ncbi:phage integrase N-terminal SAM-like domain-containing protein [Vibrio sp. qd031]|uniref:phage integrase N-terminal SAM-like domain-containing protein n=1 Tax=Vibrio sp. qd031 TaxID=1603038 RepID=UPI000A0F7701|nr:phage integrase N-terminal SAM-like domain-containing protein [Vibrio sp. qd031]
MNANELARYNTLYEQHLTNLKLQGKRPATMDAYSRAVRRISHFFDCSPDLLTTSQLKQYFARLIETHSWSTVKLDRNGLQFFYRYALDKQWEWVNIVRPPRTKKLPDVITAPQVALLITMTRQRRYQVFSLTLYSMGLRLGEALNLTVQDIDAHSMQVHIRDGKGGKGQSALEYLSRYLYRGVLPDQNIVSVENDTVTFRYRESKTKQWTTRTLPTLQF